VSPNSDINMAELTDNFALDFRSYQALDEPGLMECSGVTNVAQPLPEGWQLDGARLSKNFLLQDLYKMPGKDVVIISKQQDFVSIVAIRCKSTGCWPIIMFVRYASFKQCENTDRKDSFRVG
jgi:hypothetical protein